MAKLSCVVNHIDRWVYPWKDGLFSSYGFPRWPNGSMNIMNFIRTPVDDWVQDEIERS